MSLQLPTTMSPTNVQTLVDKHHPHILKRTITEASMDDEDWKNIENIRVICRFRPPNRREKAYSKQKHIPDKPPKFETEQMIHLSRVQKKNDHRAKQKPFKCTLDAILNPNTTQKQVFYLV
eukprot:247038_1